MRNLPLRLLNPRSSFRKIAMGTWRTVGDPSVYAQLDIDMSRAVSFMTKVAQDTGVKLTPSHLVAHAIARALHTRPELNGMIRGSRIYLRKHVDVFFQINIPGQNPGECRTGDADLSGCVVRKTEQMTAVDIARTLQTRAERVRNRTDPEVAIQNTLIRKIPWCLIRWFLNLTSFFIYGLNLNLKKLGIPQDPFGSVMVTNIGSFGVEMALAPLVPYSRVPLLLVVGAMRQKPVVEGGVVVARPVVTLGVTFDHRLVDGVHMAQMNEVFRNCFQDPERFFLEAPARDQGIKEIE